MAVTVIATPGLATSNSYSTLADAEIFMESRLHTDDWTDATDDEKNRALVWATRILDAQVEWRGWRINEIQVLEWPRSGVTDRGDYFLDDSTIPTFLQEATAELALFLLASDRSVDYALSGFKRIKVDVIELEADVSSKSHTIPSGVMDMIRFYGRILYSSSIKRVVR